MKIPLRLVAVAVVLALASCASAPPTETPAGRPECSIASATNDQVQGYLLELYMADGWLLKQQSPSQLVLWKESTGTLQNAFHGGRYDLTTTHEVRLVFSQGNDASVRIFGQVALVTNEGSASERRNDLTGGQPGHDLWQVLARVTDYFETGGAELAQGI